jgi:hypothetical protein
MPVKIISSYADHAAWTHQAEHEPFFEPFANVAVAPTRSVSASTKAASTNPGMLTRDEFDRAESDFDTHFKINGTGNIKNEWHSFGFAELQALVNMVPGEHRLVIVHYGLDGDKLRYGFSVVNGTPVPGQQLAFTYTPSPNPTHVLISTNFYAVGPGAWNTLRSAYLENIKVRRTAGPTFEDLTATDALRVVIPWEDEILHMYAETTHEVSGNFRVALDSVSMVHTAQTHEGRTSIAGYRHGVALYVEHEGVFGYTRMLDNHVLTIYKNKAADYGNLCPVRCNYYERLPLS